jgi:hypothetical protein
MRHSISLGDTTDIKVVVVDIVDRVEADVYADEEEEDEEEDDDVKERNENELVVAVIDDTYGLVNKEPSGSDGKRVNAAEDGDADNNDRDDNDNDDGDDNETTGANSDDV